MRCFSIVTTSLQHRRVPLLQTSLLTTDRLVSAMVILLALVAVTGSVCVAAPTAVQAVDDERERLTAERFLQVLMKRPRPGTSLDRVYGYHVRNQSLETLLQALGDPTSEAAGELNLQDADPADTKMVLGLIQLQRGKSAAAVDALKDAEGLRPDDAAVSYFLGKAHLGIGETELAAAAMERAIERGPARNEALAVFTELGRIYGRAGASEKALNVWTRLEKLFPGDSRVGGQIATTLADEGNVEEALKRFEALSQSARRDEEKIAFAVQAAEMKRRLGEAEQATADLEAILTKLRPGSWLYTDVRNRIEDGFLKSGDVDALAEYYQNRLKNDPDNLELMTRLGRILVTSGRLEDAKAVLQTAVERAPEDVDVRLGLIDILVRQTQITEAGKQYEELIQQDPSNPDYLLKWGQLMLSDQKQELPARREAAAKIWQRLADARSDDPVTLAQVADQMRSIDRSEDAIALYRKAIALDPASPQYREYLGEYFHQLDRKDEAIETWESIAEGKRRNVESLIRLAEIYGTFKMPEQSLETWEAASEFDLTFSQELRYANQLRAAQKFEEALERLKVAEQVAETPDERDQLLADRITTYSEAGTLSGKIAELEKAGEKGVGELRELALMHQAAGNLTDAYATIQQALKAAPENIAVLTISAEVLERQNRFADAVTYYRKLAGIDRRFQTNYLEKVAQLQVRLGFGEDALKTCEELVQANPASVDTYMFAARTALRLNRPDDGFEILRRAMTVARRDNGPRKLLASEYGKQFRTDEAIDLYWQALDFESKVEDRIAIVRSLAPLYERRGDIETLLTRIEEIGAKENDLRATQLMIAAANEAIQDYGSARQAIDRLLARQPRDVGLLEAMVRLCDASNELEAAVEFQRRILNLADTPENRFRLLNLELDAGTVDFETAIAQQMQMATDPTRIGSMLASAMRRSDAQMAKTVAKAALEKDDSLWDVKLLLAQILLYETESESDEEVAQADGDAKPSQDNDQPKQHPFEEAVALCQEVLALKGKLSSKPPTERLKKGLPAASSRYTSQYWGRSSYQLAQNYRLGQYSRSSSRRQGIAFVPPYSLGHGKILAEALTWVPKAKELSGDELNDYLKTEFEDYILPEDLQEVKQAARIRKYQALAGMASYMVEGGFVPDPKLQKNPVKRQKAIAWRTFELAPKTGSRSALGYVRQRLQQAKAYRNYQKKTADGESTAEDRDGKVTPPKKPDPLSESQLQLLTAHYDRTLEAIEKDPNRSRAELLNLTAMLKNEFELAGQPETAAKYQARPLTDEASVAEINAAIQFYLSLGQREEADKLVSRLMPAVRAAQESAGQIAGVSRSTYNGTFMNLETDFVKQHVLELLDVAIASQVHNQGLRSRGRSTISSGTIRIQYQHPQGYFTSREAKGPLSTQLLDQTLAAELVSLNQKIADESSEIPTSISLELIQHLQKPVPGAPVQERKNRNVLAAFAHWWDDRPEDCYAVLAELSETYPDDVDIRIEHARLASELGNDREALDILNSFEPLDSKMLVRKEMAALNLSVRLSDQDRAAQAAERLFGLRMDTTTQLALSDQLRRLGMKDKAKAILQRLRGGRRKDDSTSMQVAQAFLQAGEKEAAAEVAFEMLRNLNRSRNQNGNADYYRNRAVEMLKSAGRLEPLIAMARRRVEAAPKSVAARKELAELYAASGKKKEADAIWAELSKEMGGNPDQMLSQARSLYAAKKYNEAVNLYLKAFRKEPQRLNNEFYNLRNAANKARAWDQVYKELVTVPVRQMPEYRLDEIIRGDYRTQSDFSEARRKFVSHVLKSLGGNNVFNIIRQIPDAEKKKIPEIRGAILSTVTRPEAFSPTSRNWSLNSYNSDGRATGPFTTSVALLTSDEQAYDKFMAAAEEQIKSENPGVRLQARLLKAVVQLKSDDEKLQEAAETEVRAVVKSLQERPKEQPSPQNSGQWNGLLSEPLAWQVGQVVEDSKTVDEPKKLALAIYESSKAGEVRVNGGDPRYSILHPRIRCYKALGQTEPVIDILTTAFENIDNSRDNQYNPGYGDYQDLQTWQWIADQLREADAPFHALSIYRQAMSEPEKFVRASRWGGSLKVEPFEQGAEKATEKLNSDSAVRYLKWVSSGLGKDDAKSPQVSLQMLPISAFQDEQTIPSFALALQKAAESEAGKQTLQDLLTALKQQSQKEGAHWTLKAASLAVASVVEPESIEDLGAELLAALPSVEDIKSGKRVDDIRRKPYLKCFTVGIALKKSETPEAKQVIERLKPILTEIAGKNQEADSLLVLEQRFGDPRAARDRFLAELRELPDGALPSPQQVELALKMAAQLADQGDLKSSAQALTAALGRGLPMTVLNTSATGDAFALNQNRNTPSRTPQDKNTGTRLKVQNLLKQYRKPCGLVADSDLSQKQIQDNRNDVFAALLQIVVPDSRVPSVLLYERQIASTSEYDRFRGSNVLSEMKPLSAAGFLAELAAVGNRGGEVRARLRQKISSPTPQSTGLQVLLATEEDSPNETIDALRAFEATLEADLPEVDATPVQVTGSVSITTQVQNESFRKSRILNIMLNVVQKAAYNEAPERQHVHKEAARILQRAAALIQSDRYTVQRHRQILQALQTDTAKAAAAHGNQNLLSNLVGSMLMGVTNRYAGSSPESEARAKKDAMSTLLYKMSEDGQLKNSAGIIRSLIESQQEIRTDYKDGTAASLFLKILELADAEQYKLLEEVTLGLHDEAPIKRWMGFVRASTLPEPVHSQFPKRRQYQTITVCSDVVPITSTGLMLAEMATKLGRADELAKKLQNRSKDSQDEAALLAALVKLRAAGPDGYQQVESVFADMLVRLEKNKPTGDDKTLKIPELEIILTVEAMKAGMPDEVARKLTGLFRTYCTRAQQNPMTAIVGIIRSEAGFGRTPHGTQTSPLKHFVPVSIPWPIDPETPALKARHVLRKDGWASSTGGYHVNLLMLRYPVEGSFTMSANIVDGNWGEADLVYGGTMYQPQGWNRNADITLLRSGGSKKFPVQNIQQGKSNVEALRISKSAVEGLVNDEAYVKDIATVSHPWPAVSQHQYRTTQWKDFKISGSPMIPKEVNLLDETMRGWGMANYGIAFPNSKLPAPSGATTAATQDAVATVTVSGGTAIEFTNPGARRTGYVVAKGVLNWLKPEGENRYYDSGGVVQYLRPILDGEQLTWKFWWKKEESEVHPAIGRLVLNLSDDQVTPQYARAASDLSLHGGSHFIGQSPPETPEQNDTIPKPLKGVSGPKEEAWNTVTMSREGDQLTVMLNGEKVVSFEVTNEMARPGFYREPQMECQIKDMILTGDWPETLPENLMEAAE